jgi:hypothetical protein
MEARDGSSTSRPQIERLVRRIFRTCQGNYGNRFLGQWKTGQTMADGMDAGVVNAMKTWAVKLAYFGSVPEGERAIDAALENLPADPPTLPEFHEMANVALRRMRDGQAKLEHRMTPEEEERAMQASRKAAEAARLSPARDPELWMRRPVSRLAFEAMLQIAPTNSRVRGIIEDLTREGVTDGKRLLKRWDGTQWVGA